MSTHRHSTCKVSASKAAAFITSRPSLCGVERFSMTEKVFVKRGKLFPADVTVGAGEVVNSTSQNIPTVKSQWSHDVTCLSCALPSFVFFFFFLVPLKHAGCPLTEGPHQSSDPWGSGRSMTQPGYSAMVGNSPHLNQHGPFTAINPQDRLVSSAYLSFMSLWLFFFLIQFIVFQLRVIVCGSQKRQPLPLSPQNYPLHGSEVNGTHPAGVHSGSSSYGVPSHTPPIIGADTMMGELIIAV